MANVRSTVIGVEELVRNINAVGRGISVRHLDPAMKRALKPMLDSAKSKALPRRQAHTAAGQHLDEGLVIAKGEQTTRTRREQLVTATGRAMKLAHLVEFGTAPHFQPNRGVMHPGARPFPFLRPAFDENAQQTIVLVGQELWREIEKDIVQMSRPERRR